MIAMSGQISPQRAHPVQVSSPSQRGVKISLPVNLLSHADQFLGTGDRAETAPLASLLIDFDLGHAIYSWYDHDQ